MRIAICLVVLVLAPAMLAGCGQKGPLQRPEPAASVVSPPDESAPRNL